MSKFTVNSFQIPNALVDDEIIANLNANALKCYLVVVRKTVGWQKEWDYIPTTQLMKLTGIKKKTTVYSAMNQLEELGLIESEKETGKTTRYSLKVVPEKVVTKKGTSAEEGNEVVPKKDTGTSTKKGHPSKDTSKNNNQKEKINKNDCSKLVEEYKSKYETNEKLLEILEDFIAYRKQIKKPLKTIQGLRGFVKNIKAVQDSGFNLSEAIKTMKENEWNTIKPEYLKNTQQPKNYTQPQSKVQKNLNALDEFYGNSNNENPIEVEVIEDERSA